MSGPLSHIKVLDLSRVMAGPWAGQILADLGADVIKVERPGAGDDTRAWGPPFLTGADGEPTAESGYYLSVNRGKRSITIDIAKPQGRDLVRRLAERSDVLLENYKVGTLARYGMAYNDLKTINPRLIYASITGFGQEGTRAANPAYDFMIQAMGGLMSITGERDGKPGAGPQKVGVPIVDLMSGMYATVGVLAALARRAETGQGEYVDVAMLEVQAAFLANQAMNYLVSGQTPQRTGTSHPNIQPQDVYPCRDGYLALAVGNDPQFVKFAEVIGRPELSKDERFATNPARVRNNPALNAIIIEAFAADDRAAWAGKLEAAGVPAGPINSIPDILKDPEIVRRGMVRQLDHPLAGKVPQVVSPIRMTNAPLSFDRAPPLLGEQTNEILAELGIGDDDAKALRESGAI